GPSPAESPRSTSRLHSEYPALRRSREWPQATRRITHVSHRNRPVARHGTQDAAQCTAVELSGDETLGLSGYLPRHTGTGSLSVAGRPELARDRRLGRGAERGDLRLPGNASGARQPPGATHRALELSETRPSATRGRPAVPSPKQWTAAAGAVLRARGDGRRAEDADRSQRALAGRFGRAHADGAVA